MANEYPWSYCSLGGVVRVKISKGEDLKHLGELDQKLWTVLSCPTTGLEFDAKALQLLDTDKDGKIRVAEVVAAANYLTSVVKDADVILKGESKLALNEFNQENEKGLKLYESAKQILSNLGLEKDEISLADSSDSVAIFAKTRFNGDGVITPASAEDDVLAKTIETIAATVGSTPDRSGAAGVTADQIEAFYAACAGLLAWNEAAGADGVFPFGENTAAALAAVEAVKAKIDDYFMRCKLAAFDADSTAALDVQVSKIGEISAKDLSACAAEIAEYPIARVNGSQELPFEGINPAWQGAFAALKSLVLDVELKGAKSMNESQWNAIVAKFGAYKAWTGAKAGAAVEGLGLEAVKEFIAADKKAALLELVAADKAVEAEANSIADVDNFLRLLGCFYQFLRNYIAMEDFYAKDAQAVFQAGTLYIDQRSLNLCIRVADMGKQAEMASLSGMFIIYCSCVSKSTGKTANIAAILTDGDVDNLRVGMNGVFYDRNGLDYDATITKIVDNPVSIRQAFLSPYKKLARTITDRINKNAADKEKAVSTDLTNKANTTSIPTNKDDAKAAKPENKSFDIAKFAGIFAAIGMAVGFIGSALAAIVKPWYTPLIILLVLVVVISGPSMFLAWTKLRKRNLGPVLNANGWAVNSRIIVNILFGATLTDLAKFPAPVGLTDPYVKPKKKHTGLKWFIAIVVVLGAAAAAQWFTGAVKSLPHKEKAAVECPAQACCDEAPADTTIVAE